MDMPDLKTIESLGIVALCIGFAILIWRAAHTDRTGNDDHIPGGYDGGSGGDCGGD